MATKSPYAAIAVKNSVLASALLPSGDGSDGKPALGSISHAPASYEFLDTRASMSDSQVESVRAEKSWYPTGMGAIAQGGPHDVVKASMCVEVIDGHHAGKLGTVLMVDSQRGAYKVRFLGDGGVAMIDRQQVARFSDDASDATSSSRTSSLDSTPAHQSFQSETIQSENGIARLNSHVQIVSGDHEGNRGAVLMVNVVEKRYKVHLSGGTVAMVRFADAIPAGTSSRSPRGHLKASPDLSDDIDENLAVDHKVMTTEQLTDEADAPEMSFAPTLPAWTSARAYQAYAPEMSFAPTLPA